VFTVSRSVWETQAAIAIRKGCKLILWSSNSLKAELVVNGKPTGLIMKLGEAGEAFFVVETEVCLYNYAYGR